MLFGLKRKDSDRMRWYLTVVRQSDGSVIVSPGGVEGRSYRLAKTDIDAYVDWASRYYKKQDRFNKLVGIILLPVCFAIFYAYSKYTLLIFVLIFVWFFLATQLALRAFEAVFPDVSPSSDSQKWQRFRLVMLVSIPRWFCFLSVTILSPVWVGSILMLLGSANTNGHAVYPGDEIITSLLLSVITLWSGYLLVENFGSGAVTVGLSASAIATA